MDSRILGLSIVIFILTIVETSAQNFYPTRYGKRESQATDGRWPRGPQYERRSELSGNLFFGSRYGKRSYSTTPPESLTESSAPALGDRYGRSSDNSERFFFGSRFGKRSHTPSGATAVPESKDGGYLLCRYTGYQHFYHCDADPDDEKKVL